MALFTVWENHDKVQHAESLVYIVKCPLIPPLLYNNQTPFTWTIFPACLQASLLSVSIPLTVTTSKLPAKNSWHIGLQCYINHSCLHRPKIHFLLHLPDSMMQFGPPASFNTCREVMITWWWCYWMLHICNNHSQVIYMYYSMHGSRKVSNRDIATCLVVVEQPRFVCGGGVASDERDMKQ